MGSALGHGLVLQSIEVACEAWLRGVWRAAEGRVALRWRQAHPGGAAGGRLGLDPVQHLAARGWASGSAGGG